ncbi:G-protein coupled receptor GRL101-like [Mercenaria mercenaria]|uniref:G-protein coupled receptor GRL101-like n=1 Tax=Mercenaria mercenaria TaxID=6596 RepID=UPI00234E7CFD|nr:G-protein coupled receptor GRL101-like [Mercenaria mercenaria]
MGMECAQKVEVECYHTKNVVNRIWIYGYGSEPCLLYQECLDRLGNPVCNGTQNQCRCNMTEQDWSKTPRDMWFKDTFVLDNMAYVPVRVMRTKGFNLQGQLRMAVGPLVCNSTMPRSSDKIKCNNGKVVPADTRCIYNVDRYGSATGCRDNTHLLNCESFKCPYGFVKCPNSFCIPIKSVCDERMDCMFGEDESFCDTWKCPNQFRCRNSKTCIPLTQVCNGYNDCSSGDDETHCNATCPSFCTCIAGDTDCSMRKRDLRSLTYVSKDTRKLNLNNNRVFLKNDKSFFEGLDYLFELSLAYCEISLIPDLSFWNLKNLHKLDLSFNKLVKISKQSFNGLENLKEIKLEGNKLLSDIEVNSFRFFKDMTILDLSGLSLRKVAENTFQGMSKLQVLNISYNQINTVDGNAFKSLQNLQILDMQQNAISVFGKDSFAGLNTLSFLYTDSYMFCCIKPTSLDIDNCFPSPNEFSSCSDLMRNEVLRVFIWSVAIFAFFGNILSFVFRFLSERDTCKCGYGILVTNLSVADMLMGIYLLIVSIADETYRGRYIWNDVSWRNSTYCSLAGGFAIVSMESSVLILTLITLDRFKSTKFLSGFTASYVLVLCAVVWITAIIFAVIPILPLEQMKHYFGESFYSTSAVCLTLPLTTERLSGWRYSTGVLIVFNFFCFVCIAIGQSFIYVTISRTKIMLESPDRRVQFQVSRRLLAIVMVDFLAWFPVCVFGAIALYGGTVSDDAYTWVAAFVMPLKSALNPILYSYSTFSNSRLGRRILKVLRCQTTRVSTGKQVAEHLQNVRKVNKMGCLVSHQDKKYLSLKEYFTSARTIPMMNLVIVTARVAFILDKIHDTGLTVGRFGADHVMVKPDTNKTISKLVMKCLPREVKNEKEKRMNIGDFGKLLGWMLKRYNKQNVGTIEYPN